MEKRPVLGLDTLDPQRKLNYITIVRAQKALGRVITTQEKYLNGLMPSFLILGPVLSIRRYIFHDRPR